MQSYGLALNLRDDPAAIARYKKEHEHAWPVFNFADSCITVGVVTLVVMGTLFGLAWWRERRKKVGPLTTQGA